MTSEPNAPGAPAIILYREVDRDDCGVTCHSQNASFFSADRFEHDYFRIKILTDEGRKYGNIEIPLPREVGTVDDIKARVIRPDGSIVNFSGQIVEKTIVKAKGFQYAAKTFAIPDVQVGSVIEWYYTVNFQKGFIFSSDWILSQELFTKKAKFTLRPYQSDYYPIFFQWNNDHLPPGMPHPKQRPDLTVELEVSNIAAFQTEDFAPPENELKARVDFIYSWDGFESDPARFWKKVGKKRNDELESFISKKGAVRQAVSQIVSPSDPAETKLRKIYGRVQQLGNTTYAFKKTEQEQKREIKKDQETVEDVWKRGSGDQTQLNWLFLALARSAEIDAYGVWVSDRSNYFFDPGAMRSSQLDQTVVLVKLDGKDIFLDPGAKFAPFGMLPWAETGVMGLRLDKDGGSWTQTSLMDSSQSQVIRKADLKLTTEGNLEGKVTFTYTGLEALKRRMQERNQDDAARKTFLQDEVRQSVPAAIEIELKNQPDWMNSESPLVAEFNTKIPGWASGAGRRVIFSVGVFGASEKHIFEYSSRVHPIYFDFKCERADDITIELPAGWQMDGLPKPQAHDLHAVAYSTSAENVNGALHLMRKFDINNVSIDAKYYAPLRSFYQSLKSADEQQIILSPGTVTASH